MEDWTVPEGEIHFPLLPGLKDFFDRNHANLNIILNSNIEAEKDVVWTTICTEIVQVCNDSIFVFLRVVDDLIFQLAIRVLPNVLLQPDDTITMLAAYRTGAENFLAMAVHTQMFAKDKIELKKRNIPQFSRIIARGALIRKKSLHQMRLTLHRILEGFGEVQY